MTASKPTEEYYFDHRAEINQSLEESKVFEAVSKLASGRIKGRQVPSH